MPEEWKPEVREKERNSMHSAAVAFQERIIQGLEENLGGPVSLFNLLPVNSFPKYYRAPVVRACPFSHGAGTHDYNAGFLNLAYIKRLLLPRSYLRQFKAYCRGRQMDALICYTMDLSLLKALTWAKKSMPWIKTCVILPDMPEFNDLSVNQSLPKRLFGRCAAKEARKAIEYTDSFVYLTEPSADYFCREKAYTVVEGIAPEPEHEAVAPAGPSHEKRIVYTGTTNERFGVRTLLEAFSKIPDPACRLVICGCGDSDNAIREMAQTDSRISFLGVLPHEEVLALQRKATVLVNPRQNVGTFTKYSFPSKNLEYLASGVPMVGYKLDGIPAEYDPYMVYVQGERAEDLADAIWQVCQWDETKRKEYGQRASDFVRNQKNPVEQTKKILALLRLT